MRTHREFTTLLWGAAVLPFAAFDRRRMLVRRYFCRTINVVVVSQCLSAKQDYCYKFEEG
jgi:hypothetical protein